MGCYLIRYAETGRESQPARQQQKRDILDELRARLPDAAVRTSAGRIFVETGLAEADALAALGALHGPTSFSKTVHCPLALLEPTVRAFAAARAGGRRSFAVRVRRAGAHGFTSAQMARCLGQAVLLERPDLVVDLETPDVRIGVEIRDDDCYLYDAVHPGLDRQQSDPPPLAGEPRFLADQMLGRLAAWLRLLGLDTAHLRDRPDSALVRLARAEGRVLLTRDRPLCDVRVVPVFYVAPRAVAEQLRAVAQAFQLRFARARLFSRCTVCNHPVEPVDKTAFQGRLPEVAYRSYDAFTRCPACDKLYWQGGHYDRILARVTDLMEG